MDVYPGCCNLCDYIHIIRLEPKPYQAQNLHSSTMNAVTGCWWYETLVWPSDPVYAVFLPPNDFSTDTTTLKSPVTLRLCFVYGVHLAVQLLYPAPCWRTILWDLLYKWTEASVFVSQAQKIRVRTFQVSAAATIWPTPWINKKLEECKPFSFSYNFIKYWPFFHFFTDMLYTKFAIKWSLNTPPYLRCIAIHYLVKYSVRDTVKRN